MFCVFFLQFLIHTYLLKGVFCCRPTRFVRHFLSRFSFPNLTKGEGNREEAAGGGNSDVVCWCTCVWWCWCWCISVLKYGGGATPRLRSWDARNLLSSSLLSMSAWSVKKSFDHSCCWKDGQTDSFETDSPRRTGWGWAVAPPTSTGWPWTPAAKVPWTSVVGKTNAEAASVEGAPDSVAG